MALRNCIEGGKCSRKILKFKRAYVDTNGFGMKSVFITILTYVCVCVQLTCVKYVCIQKQQLNTMYVVLVIY